MKDLTHWVLHANLLYLRWIFEGSVSKIEFHFGVLQNRISKKYNACTTIRKSSTQRALKNMNIVKQSTEIYSK